MPRQFEDELTQRSRGTRQARERKARRDKTTRPGAKSKAQYTTVRGHANHPGKGQLGAMWRCLNLAQLGYIPQYGHRTKTRILRHLSSANGVGTKGRSP